MTDSGLRQVRRVSRGAVKAKRSVVVPSEPAAAAALERASEEDASDTMVRLGPESQGVLPVVIL